jgi:hypothetical protein
MQIYIPEIARKDLRFSPQHFLTLAEFFAPERITMISSVGAATPGAWALVIRAQGAFSLSRQSLDARGQGHQPTIFDSLSREERKALVRRNGTLVVDLGWEILFTYDDLVQGLVHGVEELGLDPGKTFILHCNFAAGSVIERKWRAITSLPVVRTIPFPVTLALMVIWQQRQRSADLIEGRLNEARKRLGDSSRPRRYSFFNGEPRPHRLMILCNLFVSGVLDQGHVSMLGYKKSGEVKKLQSQAEDARQYRALAGKLGFSDAVLDAIDTILMRLPLILDVDAGEVKRSLEEIAWSSPPARYYDESWFSIVSDTLFFDENVLFVTEKIFKPIINASPFFYFGNAGGLGHLLDWGFEPLGGVFTGHYDDISDGRKRMDYVLEGVIRACRMSEDDIRASVISEWPILAQNYRHFWWGYRDRLGAAFRSQVLDSIAGATPPDA